jgi:hypothetical protein
MPSENSHSAIGSAKSADAGETGPIRPTRVAVQAATRSAAPMNPSIGRALGTRREWNNSEPSKTPFTAGMKLCPKMNPCCLNIPI